MLCGERNFILKMFFSIVYCATTILLTSNGEAAHILGLFPFPIRSHFISFAPLLDELAKRGHQMTVVSAYPRKAPLQNYKDITIEDYFHQEGAPAINFFEKHNKNLFLSMAVIRSMSVEYCEHFLKQTVVQNLIHSTDLHYDLIIYEPFLSECAYGIIHKLKAPFIHISASSMSKWMGDGVGNPFVCSYIPEVQLGYTQHMTFTERLLNTILHNLYNLQRDWYAIPKMEALMRKYFNNPSIPSIYEIETNASFLLMNSHVSFNYPRPLTPNTAEVGGLHLKEAQRLPEDLQKLMNGATDGVIYFSLGTNARSVDMPEEMRQCFIRAFSKLKQKVLWKWENGTLIGQPTNVHVRKWFPQRDILAHPHVRAFITHGGLLSTQEATYFGKPLIAIPLVADQKQNSRRAAEQGYAIVLDMKNLTDKTLDWAINEILRDTRYRENAMHISSIFRDQPQKPLERAVFWTEYVIRHKGATHMRSAVHTLNFFQYYLIDVIATILLIAVISLISVTLLCCFTFRFFFFRSKARKSDRAEKKSK